MTAQEIQEARDELASLKAERLRRLTKGKVESASNGSESVKRAFGTYAELVTRIRELEATLRIYDRCAVGALHIR